MEGVRWLTRQPVSGVILLASRLLLLELLQLLGLLELLFFFWSLL